MPKLNDHQKNEIRRLFEKRDDRGAWGEGRLASAFGVSRATIRSVVKSVPQGSRQVFSPGAYEAGKFLRGE